MKKEVISENFCFGTEKSNTIQNLNEALKNHNSKFESAKELSDDFVIVLDSSVLLQYYEIPLSEKNKFKEVVNSLQDRIFITETIQQEFLSIRVDVINKSTSKLKKELEEDFEKEISKINKLSEGQYKLFSNYLNSSKFENGYNGIHYKMKSLNNNINEKLKSIFNVNSFERDIEKLKNEIDDEIKNTLEKNAELVWKDEMLELFGKFKKIEELTVNELKFVNLKFDELFENFTNQKNEKNRFPGCGEKSNKSDPVSDFIIAHEVMKFMKTKQSDVIFLTNDITKNDWINSKDKSMFVHYVTEFYKNANQNLFIFDAGQVLNLDLQDVFNSKNNNFNTISFDDFVMLNERLEVCLKHSYYTYSWFNGNHGLKLNFDWANQVHFSFTEENMMSYLVLYIWPGNTKKQGATIYQNNLDWVKIHNINFRGSSAFVNTQYEIKLTDTWGKLIRHLEFTEDDLLKETHNLENYHEISGKWVKGDWGVLEMFFENHFIEHFNWREYLDWDNAFLDSNRTVIFVSLGFKSEIWIPLDFIANVDSTNSEEEVASYLDGAINAYYKLVES